jgi:hypothetical protein
MNDIPKIIRLRKHQERRSVVPAANKLALLTLLVFLLSAAATIVMLASNAHAETFQEWAAKYDNRDASFCDTAPAYAERLGEDCSTRNARAIREPELGEDGYNWSNSDGRTLLCLLSDEPGCAWRANEMFSPTNCQHKIQVRSHSECQALRAERGLGDAPTIIVPAHLHWDGTPRWKNWCSARCGLKFLWPTMAQVPECEAVWCPFYN